MQISHLLGAKPPVSSQASWATRPFTYVRMEEALKQLADSLKAKKIAVESMLKQLARKSTDFERSGRRRAGAGSRGRTRMEARGHSRSGAGACAGGAKLVNEREGRWAERSW